MITTRMTSYLAVILAPMLMPEMAAAQDVAAGERLFRQRCGACHTVQSGQNRMGPHLSGIVGRKAGSVEGARYSQGMRDAAITWDAAQLNGFLANPRATIPGTTMTVAVPNEADRANIVSYLQGLAATSN
jgi:cytochrome c